MSLEGFASYDSGDFAKRGVCFLDLDGTVVRSARRTSPDSGGKPIAWTAGGETSGVLLPGAAQFLEAICAQYDIVPVTGRDPQQILRVGFNFSSFRVCCYGGVILDPTGRPDSEWSSHVDASLSELGDSPERTRRALAPVAARIGLDLRELSYLGQCVGFTARHPQRLRTAILQFRLEAESRIGEGWGLHDLSSEVVVRPLAIDKGRAVRWLLEERIPSNCNTLGLGDRMDDLGFLGLCDFLALPADSQLMSRLAVDFERSL